jgi:TPR repeat protein
MKITASALCLLCLSTTLFTGCSSADEKAFQSALKAAQSGSAAAQVQLGQYYEQGKGTAKDPGQSLHWRQKAALQGHAEAFQWLRRQALLGNHEADFFLSGLLDQGNALLASWIYLQARQGDAQAQYAAAWMHDMGLGLIEDPHLAMRWYERSAKQGCLLAQEVFQERLRRGAVMAHHRSKNTIYGHAAPYPPFYLKAGSYNAYLYHIDKNQVKTPRAWNTSGAYISSKNTISGRNQIYLTPQEYENMFNGAAKNRSSSIHADQPRSFNIQGGSESDMQNLEGADSAAAH